MRYLTNHVQTDLALAGTFLPPSPSSLVGRIRSSGHYVTIFTTPQNFGARCSSGLPEVKDQSEKVGQLGGLSGRGNVEICAVAVE